VELLDLVKYHNDINTLKLGSFREKELDVFFSILFKMKDKNTEEIIIDYRELWKLSNSARINSRMYKYVEGLNRKLITLSQEVTLPDGTIENISLFEKLSRNPKWNYIKVKVSPTFSYMLNDLIGNYTRFDLKALVGLKSGYSKQLFKLLKQYEGTGSCSWYWVELEEFKELLGVPENYSTTNFNKKVLKPIMEDLGAIFKNLEIIKLTKENHPVGRGKKTYSLKFTWERSPSISEKKSQSKAIEPIKYKCGTPEAFTREIREPEINQEIQQLKDLIKNKVKNNHVLRAAIIPLKTKEELDCFIEKHKLDIERPLFKL
jgi:plasmid replication initiation protein